MNIHLTPAYGRDYKSQAALLADWNSHKDFILNHGGQSTYANKASFPHPVNIQFRYNSLKSTFIHKHKP